MNKEKQEYDARMAILRESFGKKLRGRVEEMESRLTELKSAKGVGEFRESLETLQGLSHKLFGYASTFGPKPVWEIVGRLNDMCLEALKDVEAFLPEHIRPLENIIGSLKAMSHMPSNPPAMGDAGNAEGKAGE